MERKDHTHLTEHGEVTVTSTFPVRGQTRDQTRETIINLLLKRVSLLINIIKLYFKMILLLVILPDLISFSEQLRASLPPLRRRDPKSIVTKNCYETSSNTCSIKFFLWRYQVLSMLSPVING